MAVGLLSVNYDDNDLDAIISAGRMIIEEIWRASKSAVILITDDEDEVAEDEEAIHFIPESEMHIIPDVEPEAFSQTIRSLSVPGKVNVFVPVMTPEGPILKHRALELLN